MSKIAVIWGVTGQDGSYLSELLLEKDYVVYGVARRVSVDNTWRIQHLKGHKGFELIQGDITDSGCVYRILDQYFPHEVYNLAAQSHVGTSFEQPQLTLDINTMGTLNNLEAIRHLAERREIRFYQASSSEMFGNNIDTDGFQRETTVFSPRSPYAVSKVAAHQLVHTYRESYGIYACAAIMFNHESSRRGDDFVTQKIAKYIKYLVSCFEQGGVFNNYARKDMKFDFLELGNLDACRDWGHAKDYVEAMWLMMQRQTPKDYVIATGITHSIRDFLDAAFDTLDIDWDKYVKINPKYYRPAEVDKLRGDANLARNELGWTPAYTFEKLVKDMVI